MTDAVRYTALLDAFYSSAQAVSAQPLSSDHLEPEDGSARGTLSTGRLLDRLLENHVAHEAGAVAARLPCYWVLRRANGTQVSRIAEVTQHMGQPHCMGYAAHMSVPLQRRTAGSQEVHNT